MREKEFRNLAEPSRNIKCQNNLKTQISLEKKNKKKKNEGNKTRKVSILIKQNF